MIFDNHDTYRQIVKYINKTSFFPYKSLFFHDFKYKNCYLLKKWKFFK